VIHDVDVVEFELAACWHRITTCSTALRLHKPIKYIFCFISMTWSLGVRHGTLLTLFIAYTGPALGAHMYSESAIDCFIVLIHDTTPASL